MPVQEPFWHKTTQRVGERGECRCKSYRESSASNCCWLHQPSNCLCKQSGWLIKVLLWSAINCNWQIKRRTAWDRYFRSESKTYWELNLCFNSSTLLPAPSPLLLSRRLRVACFILFGAYLGAHLDSFAFSAAPGGIHMFIWHSREPIATATHSSSPFWGLLRSQMLLVSPTVLQYFSCPMHILQGLILSDNSAFLQMLPDTDEKRAEIDACSFSFP